MTAALVHILNTVFGEPLVLFFFFLNSVLGKLLHTHTHTLASYNQSLIDSGPSGRKKKRPVGAGEGGEVGSGSGSGSVIRLSSANGLPVDYIGKYTHKVGGGGCASSTLA